MDVSRVIEGFHVTLYQDKSGKSLHPRPSCWFPFCTAGPDNITECSATFRRSRIVCVVQTLYHCLLHVYLIRANVAVTLCRVRRVMHTRAIRTAIRSSFGRGILFTAWR